MPRPLSNDLRERIVQSVKGGLSRSAAARRYDVSISAAIRLVSLWQATGSWEPKQIGGYKRHDLADHAALV